MKKQSLFSSFAWWGPALLLFIIAPFTPKWDFLLSQHAYQGGSFSSNSFYQFLYDYGEWPALALSSLSLAIVLISFFAKKIARYRKEALYLFLTFAVGEELSLMLYLKSIGVDHDLSR